MSKVLVITFSNLKTDARVKRQISFFGSDFDVHVACYDGSKEYKIIKMIPPSLKLFNKIITGILLLLKQYEKAYQVLYHQDLSIKNDFDLIVANDVESLPLAFRIKGKGNAKIIFDAHEYAPRHFENKLSWRIFFQGFNTYLCKKYIPLTDAMMTIGSGIADEYEKHFGVKPIIITNAPPFHNIEPKPVDPHKIKLVHQGIANPSRKLEIMLEMMEYLDDRFQLDLMLMEPTFKSGIEYMAHLKKLAEKNKRVSFVPPKSTDQLIAALNGYDIGIVIIPPINFNYKNTLPNKFFECIQARIALAIGPIPEIKKITEQYEIGVVSSDFSPKSLAEKIQTMNAEQIYSFKQNTVRAAATLNAEGNKKIFLDLISTLI
jgi:hypothetical protein